MTLDEMIAKMKADLAAMTPEQRVAMYAEQRRSYCRAEFMMGSDRDEAEYRAALDRNDQIEVARLEAEAAERGRTFDALWATERNTP